MKTRGHLSNNGGLRGHSVGAIFPYIIMAQGMPNSLTWWVLSPKGTKCSGWATCSAAEIAAKLLIAELEDV